MKSPMLHKRATKLAQKTARSRASHSRIESRIAPAQAVDALLALAHEKRLAIFCLLVKAGPDGLSAGSIADELDVTPSTLSHHLAVLERADILSSRHHRRRIFYACSYGGVRGLFNFLTNDCCQGNPDLCGFTASENCESEALDVKNSCNAQITR